MTFRVLPSFMNCSYHTIPNHSKSEAQCNTCHTKLFLSSYSYHFNISHAIFKPSLGDMHCEVNQKLDSSIKVLVKNRIWKIKTL